MLRLKRSGVCSTVPRRIADRYLLGKQLGAGGTSRVHAALDERLGRQVAIKLLDAQLVASADPAGRERFLREGPTSASFSHRNAVTVFDAGEDAGDLYIVMELVDGLSLAERMARDGAMGVEEATDVASQVLAALTAAHAVGIVHRDIKPANVLLGTNGDVKLADFGIAKRFDDLEDSVTTTGTVIGTPRYLAPEQARGAPATPATDVYGVGILLFEMLTAQPPFAGGSLAAIAAAQQSQPAPDVRTLRPEISASLAATVSRALATKPTDRFPTAHEMAADLVDADATQLMDAADPLTVAPRSGDTQIMTRPVAVAKAPPIAVVVERERERERLKAGPLMLLVAAVAAVVVAALLIGRDDTMQFVAATDGATAVPVAVETLPTTPMPTAPEVLGPEITSASGDEIIPGFPVTDDIEVFLLQLEANPGLVGAKGGDLVQKLADLLDQKSAKKQRDQASELRDEISDWVDDGDLDAAIAQALDGLLVDLADD